MARGQWQGRQGQAEQPADLQPASKGGGGGGGGAGGGCRQR